MGRNYCYRRTAAPGVGGAWLLCAARTSKKRSPRIHLLFSVALFKKTQLQHDAPPACRTRARIRRPGVASKPPSSPPTFTTGPPHYPHSRLFRGTAARPPTSQRSQLQSDFCLIFRLGLFYVSGVPDRWADMSNQRREPRAAASDRCQWHLDLQQQQQESGKSFR